MLREPEGHPTAESLSTSTSESGQLQEYTQRLLHSDDLEAAAQSMLKTIEEVFGFTIAGIWLVTNTNTQLEPIAMTDDWAEVLDTQRNYSADQDSLSWEVFEAETPLRINSMEEHPQRYNSEPPVQSELIIPIGNYGILTIGDTEKAAFTDEHLQEVQTWTETVKAAFIKIEECNRGRHREAELKEERDQLNDFTRLIAHDLQSPLNVAQGHLSLARSNGEYDRLDTVESALDRMETIIDETLTLAQQGQSVKKTQPVDVPKLVASCLSVLEISTEDVEILDKFSIKADPDRLAHIIENLCKNAIDHGGSNVSITIGRTTDGFYIADDGPGIPPEDQDDIFTQGFTTSGEGTGLGLKIVETIVEAHNWSISVTDSASGGARFDITGVEFV